MHEARADGAGLDPLRAPRTIVDVLVARAASDPDFPVYTFLPEDAEAAGNRGSRHAPGSRLEQDGHTFSSLERRSRALAEGLIAGGLEGERVLLVHPPGLDFVEAFFACLRAGVIAVPAPPPPW